MKNISFSSWTIIYITLTLTVVVLSSVTCAPPWCPGPNRRNWRLPPPPPPPSPQRNSNNPYNRYPPWRPPVAAPVLPGRPQITLYLHENHNGFRYEQTVGNRCYNLPNVINDKASSVDTHNRCVMVCRDKDCKACKRMKRGSPGHFRLAEIGMDDSITSVKPCGDVYDSS